MKSDVITSGLHRARCNAGRGRPGCSKRRHAGFRMVGHIRRQQRGQGFVVAFAAVDEPRTLVAHGGFEEIPHLACVAELLVARGV